MYLLCVTRGSRRTTYGSRFSPTVGVLVRKPRSAGSKHFYPLTHPVDEHTLLEVNRAKGGIQW